MSQDVDLIVVGAGIQGAGIAQAAAAAGLTVLVIERRGVAAGTSSRSSKLIHGGLRYLEQFHLGLVRESLHERSLLTRLAPDLVRLVPFRIPVFAGMRRAPWQIAAGLALYRLLAGPGPGHGYARLAPDIWGGLDGLEAHGLRALFEYHDGQTDDAALTRAVLLSACRLGALLVMPAEVERVVLDDTGASVHWRDASGPGHVRAPAVVNATGPWVGEFLARVTPAQAPPAIALVQGTHLELPPAPLAANWYVEAPQDGRAVFVMPRADHVLVGTTEREVTAPGRVEPSAAEIEYLLRVVRTRFPHWDAARYGVQAAWAGVRVLPRGAGRAFGRSRETLMHTDRAVRPRLLSVCGGKLTTYRASAQQVLSVLRASLPTRVPIADTAALPLSDQGPPGASRAA